MSVLHEYGRRDGYQLRRVGNDGSNGSTMHSEMRALYCNKRENSNRHRRIVVISVVLQMILVPTTTRMTVIIPSGNRERVDNMYRWARWHRQVMGRAIALGWMVTFEMPKYKKSSYAISFAELYIHEHERMNSSNSFMLENCNISFYKQKTFSPLDFDKRSRLAWKCIHISKIIIVNIKCASIYLGSSLNHPSWAASLMLNPKSSRILLQPLSLISSSCLRHTTFSEAAAAKD